MVASSGIARYRVPALERGLYLLQLFNADRTEISFAEAARDLHLPRTSVYRIIKTLEFMGYLRSVHGATYTLGPSVLRIGSSASGESAMQTDPAGSRPLATESNEYQRENPAHVMRNASAEGA